MYTTTSKQQEGCTFKDSHPKCFITTNSIAKLSPGAVNRGDVHVLRASHTKVNSNTVCDYFDFIRANEASIFHNTGKCAIISKLNFIIQEYISYSVTESLIRFTQKNLQVNRLLIIEIR